MAMAVAMEVETTDATDARRVEPMAAEVAAREVRLAYGSAHSRGRW